MLLTENRVSQVKEKYGIPSEVWEPMVSGSAAIAKNQKYLEWIAKVWKDYVSTPERIETQDREGWMWTGTLNGLLTTIEEFDRVRPNLKKKDLYQYKDRKEVVDSLEQYKKEKARNIGTHKESEVVYEDDTFKVVVPKSHTASCYYGAGTKWCTASKDNPGHFTNYDRDGKLFYILDKSAPTSDKYYKVALNKTYKGGDTFYDAVDDSIPDRNDITKITDHPEVLNKINEYFTFSYKDEIAKISEEEKQKELERIARETEWAARRRERERRLQQQAMRRKASDEWNYEEGTSTEGIMANALMTWLKDMGEFEDKEEEIANARYEIEEMRSAMANDPEVIADPDGERAQDYGQDLNNLDEELEVLLAEVNDVYDLQYDEFTHYDLPVFEYGGGEYAVGTDAMADEAAEEQVRSLIDDVGYGGFSPGFLEWHIDGDSVAADFEGMFYDDMSENPEDYLDEDDKELDYSAKEQIEAMDEQIGEYQEELEETNDESEIADLNYQIEALEEQKIETLDDEDNYEYTEEAKENYVSNRMEEVRQDPKSFLDDYGYGEESIERYIDEDSFVEAVLESDGRGNGLASYDGEENEVSFDDEWYYIYRIN
tara:strand:+ start:2036 stop:3835 length:1800 start_codon:yes stop_codon:yes gene_type:complete